MQRSHTYLPYSDTGYFSALVIDYLANHGAARPFFSFTPDSSGIARSIEQRSRTPIDRGTLSGTLERQYLSLKKHPKVEEHIAQLRAENTFTVCTAHQPNLLTGYLYFIYKIIHAIKLSEELKASYPGKNFVPVYYMGSEDNDLDELGTFNYAGKKYRWDGDGQEGAVGRMKTQSLKPLLNELFKVLGPPGANLDSLTEMLTEAYLKHETIGAATQYLVNELFGRYGLLVLDPDDAVLKKQFITIMKDDLLNQQAYSLVSAQAEKLEEHFKAQAHPRPINLFYLKDGLRERIEKQGSNWQVLHTGIQWTETELLHELETHPERFSPNVILRGLFQETILPNVAFIGGGAEVAYWLQLKPLFEYYNVFYPVVLLRQSVLWINKRQSELREKTGLTIEEMFKPETELVRQYITTHGDNGWQTTEEVTAIEKILAQLRAKATSLDVTLRSSADAVMAKIRYQVQVLEKKMLRAEKRKMQTELLRISKLKQDIFPNNSLQERVENFVGYYLQYGSAFFDVLKDAIQPLKNEFLVIEEK